MEFVSLFPCLEAWTQQSLSFKAEVDGNWNQWTHHFSTIKETETKASNLNFHLQEAVEYQDFRQAARLKKAVEEATSNDTVAQIMSQLKKAIDDERYYDASKLCKLTGSGLVGWWVAYSKDFDDPLGIIIIRITPGLGRFIATSYTPRKPKVSDPIINVEAFAAQGFSSLEHSDVMNAYWGADHLKKVAKTRREMVQSAIIKVRKRSRSSEHTSFSRITRAKDSDPFDGLYLGAYGDEVVQLKRKFGNWNDVDNKNNNPSDSELFEYAEAVKLTGDLIVPAGQVTFRAKIESSNRNISNGRFPSLLWLGDTYKGQGRIAEFGFQNPKWVDGELVIVNITVKMDTN